MQETLSAVNIALAFIKRQRKDTAYQSFYSLVVLKQRNTLMILSCLVTEDHRDAWMSGQLLIVLLHLKNIIE